MQPVHIARLPVLFLLDTSHGMMAKTEDQDGNRRQKIDQLTDGLEFLCREIREDYAMTQAVDISVMTFGGAVQTTQEFTSIEQWDPPHLSAAGSTPLCEAIVRGANALTEYREKLRDNCYPIEPAQVWLLSDGQPTDHDHREMAQNVIGEGTEAGEMLFFAAALGNHADIDILEYLSAEVPDTSKRVLRVQNVTEFFKLASESLCGQTHKEYEGYDSKITTDKLIHRTR